MDVKLSTNPIAKDVPSLFVTHIKRNRTPLKYIDYGLYLYFLGLSYRNTSKALAQFVKRSHVAVWKWIQRYKPKKIARRGKEYLN
jgi:putative transposase